VYIVVLVSTSLCVVVYIVVLLCPVAQKSTEQANLVADSAVSGANEVAQATVDGVEQAALASGLVKPVSDSSR
jgi:hypothetical protein